MSEEKWASWDLPPGWERKPKASPPRLPPPPPTLEEREEQRILRTMLPMLELAISMHHLKWKQLRMPMSWAFRRAEEAGQVVAEKGDVLMYGGKGCASAFNALAEGLAILALCPGGVRFAGRHWEANPDDILVRDAPAA